MEQPSNQLSEAQQEYLKPAVRKVAKAFAELRETLNELGWVDEQNCLQCPCPGFEPSGNGGLGKCANPICGHQFTSHNII